MKENISISDSINEYLDSLIAEIHLSKNTQLAYTNDLNKYEKYLEDKKIYKIEKIQKDDIFNFLKYLKKKGLKPQSIAHYLTSIKN